MPIVIFLSILIARVVLIYKNFVSFPYYFLGDAINYVVLVFFLDNYGFHSFVPNFYNGFVSFTSHYAGWSFFTLPFSLLVGDILLGMYVALIMMLILGFVGVVFLGKIERYNWIKKIAFYLFLFGNPLSIDIIFNILRFGEVLAWVLFIPFFTIILYFKKHRLDKKFILFIVFYSFIILTHPFVAVLASFSVVPLFWIKNLKERVMVGGSVVLAWGLTAFWWIPFLAILDKPTIGRDLLRELLFSSSFISYNTLFLLGFFGLVYLYWKSNKLENYEKKFLIPFVVLAFVVLSRLILFIPLFNKVPPNSYNILFLILNLYLFFRINFSEKIKKILGVVFIILAVISLVIVVSHPRFSLESQEEWGKEIVEFVPLIEENSIFLFRGGPNYVAYGLVNYNLTLTFASDLIHHEATVEVMNDYEEIRESWDKKECGGILENLEKYDIGQVIARSGDCEFLKECGLKTQKQGENACLLLN